MRILKQAIGALLLFVVTAAQAQYHKYDFWEENYQVQGLLGVVQYENLKFDAPDSTTPKEVDVSLIPQFGGAWMTKPWGGDRFQAGLECSFLLGMRFDKLNYLYAGGQGIYVSLSVSMWTVDLAGGVYANIFLDSGKKVRIYAGAGPLINYANYRTESDYSTDGTNSVPADVSDGESAFGIGVYARTGVEFRIHYRGTVGLGARGSWSNVDFTEYGGSSELVGLAGFVTYTAGF